LPVLCYGLANYRHEGAVYCLDATPETTSLVTRQLASGNSELSLERAQAAYDRVMGHQWRCEDIRHRLPALLDSMLADSPRFMVNTKGNLNLWSRLQSWLGRNRAAA
jgi:hypothetical protein